jgi:carbamoyltransferase
MTNFLGINGYHGDVSAALVVDGQFVAAVEEERLNRIKHWAGFPAHGCQPCTNLAIAPRHCHIDLKLR